MTGADSGVNLDRLVCGGVFNLRRNMLARRRCPSSSTIAGDRGVMIDNGAIWIDQPAFNY
jgi:hypothetical protein